MLSPVEKPLLRTGAVTSLVGRVKFCPTSLGVCLVSQYAAAVRPVQVLGVKRLQAQTQLPLAGSTARQAGRQESQTVCWPGGTIWTAGLQAEGSGGRVVGKH